MNDPLSVHIQDVIEFLDIASILNLQATNKVLCNKINNNAAFWNCFYLSSFNKPAPKDLDVRHVCIGKCRKRKLGIVFGLDKYHDLTLARNGLLVQTVPFLLKFLFSIDSPLWFEVMVVLLGIGLMIRGLVAHFMATEMKVKATGWRAAKPFKCTSPAYPQLIRCISLNFMLYNEVFTSNWLIIYASLIVQYAGTIVMFFIISPINLKAAPNIYGWMFIHALRGSLLFLRHFHTDTFEIIVPWLIIQLISFLVLLVLSIWGYWQPASSPTITDDSIGTGHIPIRHMMLAIAVQFVARYYYDNEVMELLVPLRCAITALYISYIMINDGSKKWMWPSIFVSIPFSQLFMYPDAHVALKIYIFLSFMGLGLYIPSKLISMINDNASYWCCMLLIWKWKIFCFIYFKAPVQSLLSFSMRRSCTLPIYNYIVSIVRQANEKQLRYLHRINRQ